jgi:NADH:ubiquinone oxidoreductase subunit 6 (subunit J)
MLFLADISPAAAETILFYVFALMAAGSALTLVVSRNIVRTAVCLLFTLMGVAGLYFLLHAEFLAAVQLVVYAGGTLILIVFGVMLTSKSPFSRFDPKGGEVVIAMSVGMVLLVALIIGIANYPFPQSQGAPTGKYPVVTLGQALLGDYLIPFEIASVLLLVVMIGAAYLAKARRREGTGLEQTAASKTMRQWS